MKAYKKYIIIVFIALFWYSFCFAGIGPAGLHSLSQSFKSFFQTMITVVRTFCLILSIFYTISLTIKLLSGDREGAKKIFWFLIGFVCVFSLLTIIKSL